MPTRDARGLALTGATPAALAAYEQALAACLSWRAGADRWLDQALAEAPTFAMALLLKGYLLAGSRDPRRVQAARPWLAAAGRAPLGDHERAHVAALAKLLADDYDGAADVLDAALRERPRDVLALTVASGIDYLGGQVQRMRERVERVLPAWPADLPTYQSLRAMQGFALVECGEVEAAAEASMVALSLDADDARAHHALAHVFETAGRPEDGRRWLTQHQLNWSGDTLVATHGWWHLALFHLALEDEASALGLYDQRIRDGRSTELSDLIDASALLWRLRLRGLDAGARWTELAQAWSPHIDDAFCSFSDVHAMLAFVGARDDTRVRRLERTLMRSARQATRHGRSTRLLGLAACEGVAAFARGDLPRAITALASLPAQAHRLGGSHAQRDVLHLTLLAAVESMRRPVRTVRATQETRPSAARHAAAMTPA